MKFAIRVAKQNILIHSISLRMYELCEPYLAEETVAPDVEIRITDSLIRTEEKRNRSSNIKVADIRGIEWTLLHRMISDALLEFDTILMHGAVVAIDNKAYMFTAKSGTGKTTHIQRWLANIDNAYVVNGDKPFIIVPKTGEAPLACGSPWAGKEKLQTNTTVPLKAIVMMERAEENHIEQVPFARVFPILLQQVYQPKEKEKMQQTLKLIQQLSKTISIYRFQFNNFKSDCFDVAYNALIKGKINIKNE